MFLRLLFVLLSALNIAVAAWLVLGQPYARSIVPADPGVHQLRLLSEMPGGAGLGSAEVAAANPAAMAANPSGEVRCLALGPFATPQDLRQARQALTSRSLRTRFRQEQASQTTGWWVYLPASASRNQALEQARKLAARNIQDYFVVNSGDQQNTISLGLFRDPENARKRRQDVIAAGFPAKLTERTETVPEYWLDLMVPEDIRLDWQSAVQAHGIDSRTTACF